MKLKRHSILFVTSFIPVIAFKVVARVGEATVGQAKIATVLGLTLALIQLALSKRFLKHTTYLEKAFLGFLGAGTVWVYLIPPPTSTLFVEHSTALLYLILFLTTLIPQVFGYDPFTYAIAKQWYPEAVWKTPQFRTINLHITYFWSGLFFVAFLSCLLGHGKPLFAIAVPLILVLGFGLPFSKKYPHVYLQRKFPQQRVDPSLFPATARELVSRMPLGFDAVAAGDLKADIQFDLSGEHGGKMVLSISNGKCTFYEGETPSPTLTVSSSGEVWLKIARGEIDRPKALMEGLFRAKGDMNLLMRLGELFHPPTGPLPKQVAEKEKSMKKGGKTMKILAVQGSPRPKASNTETLLQEFLKGCESQGAQAETIYLQQKNIHYCVGCYTCWTKTPGVCVFKDDMPELLEKVRGCDILVYATPLYNFNVTSLLKIFQERLLPLFDPHLVKTGDAYHHPPRYAMTPKMVLISNCGFPEASHFDGLRHVFRHLEKNSGAPLIGELLMPVGETLKNPAMREKSQPILRAAYQAGVEAVRDGRVSKETEAAVQKPVISADEIATMANLWWDSHLEGVTKGQATQGKMEDMRFLLRGMAIVFNPKAGGDLKATIQFDVSGPQSGQWYLLIENGTCTYHEGRTDNPTLTIKTPSDVWLAIANRELDGQQAFMEGKYAASGDFSLLMRMKSLFASPKE